MKNFCVKKAVVPVAGLGTRMLPATKEIPKEMLPIVTTPIIQLIVEEIFYSGIEEIILITNSKKGSIEEHFDKNLDLELKLKKNKNLRDLDLVKRISELKTKIITIKQGEPLGLGHAVLCSMPVVKNEPFALILPDMILSKNDYKNNLFKLKKNFEKSGNSQILLGKIEKKHTKKYGIAKVKNRSLVSIIEKPDPDKAPSNLFVVGRYILDKEIFKFLKKTKPDKSGEIQLTGALQDYLLKNEIKFEHLEGEVFDCGDKLGYLKAIIKFGLEDKFIKRDLKSFLKKQL